jgi:hypothetical protein
MIEVAGEEQRAGGKKIEACLPVPLQTRKAGGAVKRQ